MNDLRDRLAREIREALSSRDDATQPVVVIVRGLVDRIAELEAVAEEAEYMAQKTGVTAALHTRLRAAGYLGVGNE